MERDRRDPVAHNLGGSSPDRRLHRGGGGHERQPRAIRRDGSGDDRYALDFGRHRPPVRQGN
jgi:hypothetical protein